METIDLGLPSGTLWASCNLGASSLLEFGDYFAWGDSSPKTNYIGRTCATYDLNIGQLKLDDYVNRNNVLDSDYDAARAILGDNWRLPSGTQAQELIDNCSWEWVENYNITEVNGMLGKSKHNGATIFLPTAGYRNNTQLLMVGQNGGYWTGAPNFTAANRAWSIAFDRNVINVFNHGLRYNGYSIRPVKNKEEDSKSVFDLFWP